MPIMTESEAEDFVREFATEEFDAGTSLVGVLDTTESPIPSLTVEGSPHHVRGSVTQVPESPADPNTRASLHELLEPSPEKSAIPEEAPTVQARVESRLELGEIPMSTTDKSMISLGKSPIVGVAQGAPFLRGKIAEMLTRNRRLSTINRRFWNLNRRFCLNNLMFQSVS